MRNLYHRIRLWLWVRNLIAIADTRYGEYMAAQAMAQGRELGRQEMLVSVLPALRRQWDG